MLCQRNASKGQLGLSIPHKTITTAKLLGERELLTTSLQERTLPMWPDMGSVFFLGVAHAAETVPLCAIILTCRTSLAQLIK